MSTRLPLLDRPASAPPATEADEPRASVPRRLLCVAGHEPGSAQAHQFASGLVRALAARTRVAALVASDEASAEQRAQLREAGADPVLAFAAGELRTAAVAALATLPESCVVVGLGSAIAAALEAAFTVRIAPAYRLDGSADLELPRDAPLVAAALAETLAATGEKV